MKKRILAALLILLLVISLLTATVAAIAVALSASRATLSHFCKTLGIPTSTPT